MSDSSDHTVTSDHQLDAKFDDLSPVTPLYNITSPTTLRPPPLSPTGSARTSVSLSTEPEVEGINEMITLMKRTLLDLGMTFDHFGEATTKFAGLVPAVKFSHELYRLQKRLEMQDRKQEDQTNELKSLLTDVLKEQIAAHLGIFVQEQIRQKIQERVEEQVRVQLQKQIPEELRAQVREHKIQIELVERALYNSEARRENSSLRQRDLSKPLRALRLPNGEENPRFPKNLATLFALDTESARQLVTDFDLPDANNREINLNRFMSHIGVAFQMMTPTTRPPLPALAAP
ncbi:hypothetical protein BOTBODRAFT_51374 [Botryobasidium botryosum FD-172 SS1]|uniref:Uncharacterized protein n=1 Tax=Botryobasidium botryosum (strain FD-172 SS1) TaxID=930990 RepID=A0A067N7A7_BOTB1|nr:hypothetical protein BOTBODRAFT_51374 [Botryobasidium botryosum FD-172 SS1]